MKEDEKTRIILHLMDDKRKEANQQKWISHACKVAAVLSMFIAFNRDVAWMAILILVFLIFADIYSQRKAMRIQKAREEAEKVMREAAGIPAVSDDRTPSTESPINGKKQPWKSALSPTYIYYAIILIISVFIVSDTLRW